MSNMNSLFAQLKESRVAAMNEGAAEDTGKKLDEGVDTSAANDNTEVSDEVNEEVITAVFCADCGALISGSMNESELDSCPCCGSEELLEKEVKVVRDGKVVKKKVRTGAKPRISAAQKAALAKARKKAHTASANKKRAKSMKKGAAAGLHEEDLIICTECGFEGTAEEFDVNDNGEFICPECGAICEAGCARKSKNESMSDDDVMAKLLEDVNAPEFVKNALSEGKHEFVASYIDLKLGK